MPAYVFSRSWSYHDYLQAKNLHDVLSDTVAGPLSDIVATQSESQAELRKIREALEVGSITLATGLAELNATFEWGFGELLMAVGRLQDSLQSLLRIAKAPAQTWAYEQFEIARDAYRRRLFNECLEHVDRAIGGFGSNTGYALDYRFHYLRGVVLMGSFYNRARTMIRLPDAQQAFCTAARYALHDTPQEASRSFLAAGWCAYCQGDVVQALELTRKSQRLNGSLSTAHYQLAKILMHSGRPAEAIPHFKAAVDLDRRHALKVLDDSDFTRHPGDVASALEELRSKARYEMAAVWTLVQGLKWMRDFKAGSFTMTKLGDPGVASALAGALQAVETANAKETYFGYLDATSTLRNSARIVVELFETFVHTAEAERVRQLRVSETAVEQLRDAGLPVGCIMAIALLLALMVFMLTGGLGANNWPAALWALIFLITLIVSLSRRVDRSSKIRDELRLQQNLRQMEPYLAQLGPRARASMSSALGATQIGTQP